MMKPKKNVVLERNIYTFFSFRERTATCCCFHLCISLGSLAISIIIIRIHMRPSSG